MGAGREGIREAPQSLLTSHWGLTLETPWEVREGEPGGAGRTLCCPLTPC